MHCPFFHRSRRGWSAPVHRSSTWPSDSSSPIYSRIWNGASPALFVICCDGIGIVTRTLWPFTFWATLSWEPSSTPIFYPGPKISPPHLDLCWMKPFDIIGKWGMHRLIDWLIDRLIDWLIDRWKDWLIDWSTDWRIDWLIDPPIEGLIDWLIDRFIGKF